MSKVVRLFFKFVALVPYFWWRIGSYFTGETTAFQGASQFCSLFPGKIGTLFRAAFYKLSLKNTSQQTSIAFLTSFSNTEAQLGKHVSMGVQCNIGKAIIGDNCIFASHVCVTSGSGQHSFDDLDIPIRLQDGTFTAINIGADCWIGTGAIIMADIGEGCVVAAGSVVTEAIPPFSVVAGVPAKVIRSRLKNSETTLNY